MFAVVGCGDCAAVWVVEGEPATTGCPRCGRRHRFASLRRLAEAEDEATARAARTAILADRHGTAEERPPDMALPDDLDGVGIDDETYLAGAGIDTSAVEAAGERAERGRAAGGRSQIEIVRAALRDLDEPDAAAVVAYARDRGVPEAATRNLLAQLVEAGEAIVDSGQYRLL